MLEIFFFKNHVENESGGLVPDLLFFKKLYKKQKQVPSISTLIF